MDTRGMFVVICGLVKRPQAHHPVHTFLARSQMRRCSAFCFCFHTEGSRGRTREGAVQCSVGSSAPRGRLDGVWMPTLVPVSRVAPAKWLKSSEPHFLLRKINGIYQDEFLAFKVIIYGVYACACVPIVCYQTKFAACRLKDHRSRIKFGLERNLFELYSGGWEPRRRQTLVWKPSLRFLPGPGGFKGV